VRDRKHNSNGFGNKKKVYYEVDEEGRSISQKFIKELNQPANNELQHNACQRQLVMAFDLRQRCSTSNIVNLLVHCHDNMHKCCSIIATPSTVIAYPVTLSWSKNNSGSEWAEHCTTIRSS
jgi:hypothetical protein